jgi:hypothetical protein
LEGPSPPLRASIVIGEELAKYEVEEETKRELKERLATRPLHAGEEKLLRLLLLVEILDVC